MPTDRFTERPAHGDGAAFRAVTGFLFLPPGSKIFRDFRCLFIYFEVSEDASIA
jgi:hypothetical protein